MSSDGTAGVGKYDKYALVTLSQYNKQYADNKQSDNDTSNTASGFIGAGSTSHGSGANKGKRYIKIPRDHLIQHLYSVLERIDMTDADKMAVFNEVYRDLETKAKNAAETEDVDKQLMPPPPLQPAPASPTRDDLSSNLFETTTSTSTPARSFTLGTTQVAEQLTDKLKDEQGKKRKHHHDSFETHNKSSDSNGGANDDAEITGPLPKRHSASRIPSSVYVSPGTLESPSTSSQALGDSQAALESASSFPELINKSLKSLFVDARGFLCSKDTGAPLVMNADASKIFKHLTDPAQKGTKRPNGCNKFLEILARAGLGRNLIKNVDDQQYYDEIYNPTAHALQYDEWDRF